VFVALLLPVLGVACSLTPGCVEPVSRTTVAQRVRNAPRGGAEVAAERATDQGLARQVRRAIHADRGLVSAARAVAVTTDQGVVRLVGWVRTDKERSSIAFKAGQMARAGGVDDRVTVGNCVREAAR
jgi:osmotically-inducible protein OsmY